jgi:hypothetical protein
MPVSHVRVITMCTLSARLVARIYAFYAFYAWWIHFPRMYKLTMKQPVLDVSTDNSSSSAPSLSAFLCLSLSEMQNT